MSFSFVVSVVNENNSSSTPISMKHDVPSKAAYCTDIAAFGSVTRVVFIYDTQKKTKTSASMYCILDQFPSNIEWIDKRDFTAEMLIQI